jgi:hypothetical protein
MICASPNADAQWWDLGRSMERVGLAGGESPLDVSLEVRTRYESREGVAFGKKPDANGLLLRTRLGLTYAPVKWLKVSSMMQDSRSPWFGDATSSNTRGTADLQEAYMELFPGKSAGFGMSVGRRMLKYGDGRLINTPQWGNVNRTFDHASISYALPGARLEFLLLSQASTYADEFNRPALGDRVWGMYNTFPNALGRSQAEFYVLRRSLNRTAGFKGGSQADGTDRLGITAYGGRLTGPLDSSSKYTVEAVLQKGKVGAAEQRAFGWVSNASRRWSIAGKNLDLTGEYKFATGTDDPTDVSRTNRLDTFYASNHDRFGHQDLFAWSNIHNARGLAKYALTKSVAVNLMYNNSWLSSERDALYTNTGGVIAQDKTGQSGRHVGQELDLFFTWEHGVFEFGAGYGRFFRGDFIRNASPGVNPNYIYIYQAYSF